MQKKWAKTIGLFTVATSLVVGNGQIIAAAEDEDWKVKPGVETLWEQDQKESTPSFISGNLSEEKVITEKDIRKFFEANQDIFKMNPTTDLAFDETNTDKLGMTHYTFRQKIQNVPIDNSKCSHR